MTSRTVHHLRAGLFGSSLLLLAGVAAAAPIPVATYNFDGNLAADELGAPSLLAIDPLGANAFVTDTVFGTSKTVYRFDGNAAPVNQQAGLELNTTTLLSGPAYSVDIVFSLDTDRPGSWERILDASNRSSDNGLYVQPNRTLQVFPVGGGPTVFTFGDYHRVTLTNDGSGHVSAFMDGIFQFDLNTTVMDFATYGVANPDRLLAFFADNLVGGGQQEFSDGYVSLIRLYDIELDADEVGDIDPSVAVPEPASLVLLGAGLIAFGSARRRG